MLGATSAPQVRAGVAILLQHRSQFHFRLLPTDRCWAQPRPETGLRWKETSR